MLALRRGHDAPGAAAVPLLAPRRPRHQLHPFDHWIEHFFEGFDAGVYRVFLIAIGIAWSWWGINAFRNL